MFTHGGLEPMLYTQAHPLLISWQSMSNLQLCLLCSSTLIRVRGAHRQGVGSHPSCVMDAGRAARQPGAGAGADEVKSPQHWLLLVPTPYASDGVQDPTAIKLAVHVDKASAVAASTVLRLALCCENGDDNTSAVAVRESRPPQLLSMDHSHPQPQQSDEVVPVYGVCAGTLLSVMCIAHASHNAATSDSNPNLEQHELHRCLATHRLDQAASTPRSGLGLLPSATEVQAWRRIAAAGHMLDMPCVERACVGVLKSWCELYAAQATQTRKLWFTRSAGRRNMLRPSPANSRPTATPATEAVLVASNHSVRSSTSTMLDVWARLFQTCVELHLDARVASWTPSLLGLFVHVPCADVTAWLLTSLTVLRLLPDALERLLAHDALRVSEHTVAATVLRHSAYKSKQEAPTLAGAVVGTDLPRLLATTVRCSFVRRQALQLVEAAAWAGHAIAGPKPAGTPCSKDEEAASSTVAPRLGSAQLQHFFHAVLASVLDRLPATTLHVSHSSEADSPASVIQLAMELPMHRMCWSYRRGSHMMRPFNPPKSSERARVSTRSRDFRQRRGESARRACCDVRGSYGGPQAVSSREGTMSRESKADEPARGWSVCASVCASRRCARVCWSVGTQVVPPACWPAGISTVVA